MIKGVIAALLAGAMWGITFVAARAVVPFTELELAVARNIVFGVASMLLMAWPEFRPTGISRKDRLMSMLLGFIGYVGIFLSISFAVKSVGASIPPLIVGLMPVLLSLAGNFRERSISWSRLAIPLALITVGIAVTNLSAFLQVGDRQGQANYVFGITCSIAALALWILYGILNANVMRKPNAPAALPWTALHGLGALAGSIPLAVIVLASGDATWQQTALSSGPGLSFLFWAMISGIGGSWIAAWAWAIASRELPLSLSAQLLVSEVCFGLLFGFIYEGRWPTLEEFSGATLMIVGVVLAVRTFLSTRNRDKMAVSVA